MKVKIFMDEDIDYLEEKINEWILRRNITNIKFIKQSESMGAQNHFGLTISIWYE